MSCLPTTSPSPRALRAPGGLLANTDTLTFLTQLTFLLNHHKILCTVSIMAFVNTKNKLFCFGKICVVYPFGSSFLLDIAMHARYTIGFPFKSAWPHVLSRSYTLRLRSLVPNNRLFIFCSFPSIANFQAYRHRFSAALSLQL